MFIITLTLKFIFSISCRSLTLAEECLPDNGTFLGMRISVHSQSEPKSTLNTQSLRLNALTQTIISQNHQSSHAFRGLFRKCSASNVTH